MNDPAVFDPQWAGPDAPRAGFYSLERRNKVPLPVKVWFGQPVDLEGEPGATLDRSPRWQIMVADRLIDPRTKEREWDLEWEDVWPACSGDPISESEYRYRMARVDHAKTAGSQHDPWGKRTGRIDLLTAPIPE